MFYQLYELNHAAMAPYRAMADVMRLLMRTRSIQCRRRPWGRTMAASLEMFERTTRRYGNRHSICRIPSSVRRKVAVREEVVWSRPFCDLLHFSRNRAERPCGPIPRILIVAPMSGHYATLLRGTVEALLPSADVYITDWIDARMVPMTDGTFDFNDYVDYIIEMLHFLGPDTHVVAVCQPSVPVLAAAAVMEEANDPLVAGVDDADGRTDRYPHQSDRRQPAGQGQAAAVVRRQRHHERSLAAAGLHASGLSRLPAALRLHVDEP
jgi:poly(3-hydroxybutyrate) depolymerase